MIKAEVQICIDISELNRLLELELNIYIDKIEDLID
jgi:hypothetical protein